MSAANEYIKLLNTTSLDYLSTADYFLANKDSLAVMKSLYVATLIVESFIEKVSTKYKYTSSELILRNINTNYNAIILSFKIKLKSATNELQFCIGPTYNLKDDQHYLDRTPEIARAEENELVQEFLTKNLWYLCDKDGYVIDIKGKYAKVSLEWIYKNMDKYIQIIKDWER